jgi:hypothetical protein
MPHRITLNYRLVWICTRKAEHLTFGAVSHQLGNLNILVTGAILGITTVLSMKATESVRFSAVSRLFP